MQLDPIARGELNAPQRCGLERILPLLAGRREHHLDAPELRFEHDTKPKLGLAVADPSLSGYWLRVLHEKGRGHYDPRADAQFRFSISEFTIRI
jgi:hypothetical protein